MLTPEVQFVLTARFVDMDRMTWDKVSAVHGIVYHC
jgi:hypothetical protein